MCARYQMNGDGLVHALAQFVKWLCGFQEAVQWLEVYAAVHFFGKLLHLFLEIMQIAIRQQTCAADGLQTNHEGLIMHARNRLGQLEAPVHRAACNLESGRCRCPTGAAGAAILWADTVPHRPNNQNVRQTTAALHAPSCPIPPKGGAKRPLVGSDRSFVVELEFFLPAGYWFGGFGFRGKQFFSILPLLLFNQRKRHGVRRVQRLWKVRRRQVVQAAFPKRDFLRQHRRLSATRFR